MIYYTGPEPNFGDELNLWMWHELDPALIDVDEEEVFFHVQSIGSGVSN